MSNTALFRLSAHTISDEEREADLAVLDSDMRAEIERLMAEEKAEATRDAATAVLALRKMVRDSNANERATVRSLRAQADSIVDRMNQRDKALAYGMATGNYVPALLAVGQHYDCRLAVITYAEFARLSQIPEGWTPDSSSDEG